MSNEINVLFSLKVNNIQSGLGNIDYQSDGPRSYLDDMAGNMGPGPGVLTATLAGVNLVFPAGMTLPGWITMVNLDLTNFVTWGLWDSDHSRFHPIGELLPKKGPVGFRLSRYLKTEYTGTGTGSAEAGIALRFRADTAPCNVVVEAFQA